MPKYAIGVDLGGTNLRVAAVDGHGSLREKVTLSARNSAGRDAVIQEMCQAVASLGARFGKADLSGIGIGVPGVIDLAKGILRESPNLPGWAEYPVKAEIERRLGATVFLENDANAAALGEQWLGAAKGVADTAILTLGTGIGGAVIFGGKIWHGMTGMAGEFGHMTLNPEGPVCKCGNRGCLEEYASATAVVRMARDVGLARGGSTAREVYELALAGNDAANGVFHRVGKALGIAVANLINALNLPLVVVGGGVSEAWDLFAPALFDELRWRSMVYRAAGGATRVTKALLGGDAGIYGAARLAMPKN